MLVYFHEKTRTVYGLNNRASKEDTSALMKDGCKWIDSDEIPHLSEKEEWYLTEDNQIGVRAIKATETALSEQEEISIDTALNVEYMVCLMEESLGLE